MSSKKKAEKAPQAKGAEAESIIESYLIEQYRPFAVNDIIQNLHNKVSRTNTIKALESLTKQQRITCKTFGKIAIYVCNEQELTSTNIGTGTDVSIETVTQLREELLETEKDRSEYSAQLQGVMRHPPNEELLAIVEAKKAEVLEVNNMLQNLLSDWKPENEELIQTVRAYEQKIGKELSARKKILNSAIALMKEALSLKNIDEFLVRVMPGTFI
ncbi:Hop2p [Lachancea thermotolerans CBS 6340]|uniref:KLTH0H09240p n=1 Tax=Lachancea thermotolerans (strain ATCC 56472 / CBS 6340 / NRRL Y-8284) TaxID=559295 RepID=C5E303_LACTC|nr:KLTH0H09240p [Lachancea thermotolerans CBS 6340]CAR30414.1 KLTH0H09240p [Lachancea thermotolerans CBS 6340]